MHNRAVLGWVEGRAVPRRARVGRRAVVVTAATKARRALVAKVVLAKAEIC